jgi:hypothetical protein
MRSPHHQSWLSGRYTGLCLEVVSKRRGGRISSGSSLADSTVEPTRSQNITVKCRRSASGRSEGVLEKLTALELFAKNDVSQASKTWSVEQVEQALRNEVGSAPPEFPTTRAGVCM